MSDNQIKKDRFESLLSQDVILVVKSDYGYRIERWIPGGVAPASDYDTPQEAAARVCQLLKLTDPVAPQNWPEIAQIGGDGRAAPPRPARS